jgi:hypothetical protein
MNGLNKIKSDGTRQQGRKVDTIQTGNRTHERDTDKGFRNFGMHIFMTQVHEMKSCYAFL